MYKLRVGDTIYQGGSDFIISKIENNKVFKISLITKEESELFGDYFKTGYIIR